MSGEEKKPREGWPESVHYIVALLVLAFVLWLCCGRGR